MKMKMIDFLQKVKIDKPPKKIWYRYNKYIFDEDKQEYFMENTWGGNKLTFSILSLSDEIVILEDTPKKIEELDIGDELNSILQNDNNPYLSIHEIHKALTKIKSKENEIIDKLNEVSNENTNK